MSGINITVNKKKLAPERTPFSTKTPYDNRFCFYAAVTEVHPENNTVHVVTDTGIELMNVKVSSSTWVTYIKDGKPQLTGERYLPPVGTYVLCIMPNGRYEESIVLCSLFSDAAIHSDYMEEGENGTNIRKTVENGGWEKTTDYRTGTKTLKNKTEDETINVEIDQESEGAEKVTVTIHGNIVTVNKDGIEITTDGEIKLSAEKDATIELKGNANIKVTKDATIEAQNVTVKSSIKTEIKGGQVKLAGTVAPTGSGALCGLPACLFTGAPHVGDTSTGA